MRFGYLLVLEDTGKRSVGRCVIWKCLCDKEFGGCGNYCEVSSNSLVGNRTKSCGCLKTERQRERFKGNQYGKITGPKNRKSFIVGDKKLCNDCNEYLPLDAFYSNKMSSDGFKSICKECVYYRGTEFRHGITRKQHCDILEKQNYKCPICCLSIDISHRRERDIHVDHDHDTGEVRGVLHSICNTHIVAMVERFENIEEIVLNTKNYLSKGKLQMNDTQVVDLINDTGAQ